MTDVVKIVNDGLTIITDRIKGVGAAEPKYVHWGTGGSVPATITDVSLETPGTESRAEGVSSVVETTPASGVFDTYQVIGELTCNATPKAISEVGLFNHATDTTGHLFLRGSFLDLNLNPGDRIEFVLKTVFADGS